MTEADKVVRDMARKDRQHTADVIAQIIQLWYEPEMKIHDIDFYGRNVILTEGIDMIADLVGTEPTRKDRNDDYDLLQIKAFGFTFSQVKRKEQT